MFDMESIKLILVYNQVGLAVKDKWISLSHTIETKGVTTGQN